MKSQSKLASVVVADTGPLIALAKASLLELMSALFGRVYIPEAVAMELQLDSARPDSAALRRAIDSGSSFCVRKAKAISAQLAERLDAGEAEAIALASELGAVLLVDERKGRAAALHENVSIIGTGRLLLAAKKRGHVAQVGPILATLRQHGYRLADSLAEYILAEAAELPCKEKN
ncbi:MAG: DUF3368 domain-containing protein [Verrucomicrobia bacterium]|nr:DUF3368 domain-containing protein [Verrucomicrobiota bacterium]